MEFVSHVIGGEEVDSADGGRFASADPWTREPWAQVALGGEVDARRAVAAAHAAFDDGPWPSMGFAERGRILHRLTDLIEERAEDLAMAVTTDMGKPIADSMGKDLPRAAANLHFFADDARLSTSELFQWTRGTTPTRSSSRREWWLR